MKKALSLAFALCLGGAAIACAQDEGAAAPAAEKPDTLSERAGYAFGHNMGANMKQQDLGLDLEAMVQGLRDGLAGAEAALTEEEMQAAVNEFQQQMMAKQQEAAEKAKAENMAAGDAFRATNGAREGVTTTASGLQYEVLTAGTGPKPATTDRVSVHYRGTLVDGTQFDASYDRGQPATFPVTGVIKGWQEVLQLMPVGSKWKVVIPPDLAYGERGSPPRIGPGSTLVFEVELLGIEGQEGGGEAAPESGGAAGGGG
jgi:FKBP-type peptidyl-prolyl cis-trans isomerase